MRTSASRPEPPYVRIVAEIRRRITTGELREGDRVPSARQITREWGVAIATATKVLAALRREGLVRARPGVGTVVDTSRRPSEPGADPERAPKSGREAEPGRETESGRGAGPRRGAAGPAGTHPDRPARAAARRRSARDPEHELTRERITRTAIEIADSEGLDALSMRRIATEIGVATMSLYRHVPSKEDLVILMSDRVFGDIGYPEPPAGWRARVDLGARTQWAVYRRHPWAAQAMSFTRPIPAPKAMAHTEWLLRALDGFGLADQITLHIAITVANYVRGTAVNFEMEAEARRDTGMTDEQWMEEQDETFTQIITSGPYPLLARMVIRDDIDLDLDTLFEFGLERLLDGVESLLAAATNRPPGH